MVGRVTAYRPKAGFGFITPSHGCGDVFVQSGDVQGAAHDLEPGDVVEFDPEVGADGQLKAVHVRATAPGA